MSALASEVSILTEALGDGEASKLKRSVTSEMGTRAGRQRLRNNVPCGGESDLEYDQQLNAASTRALHHSMLYAAKKRLQQEVTMRRGEGDDGTTGGSYRCVPPQALVNRLANPPLMNAAAIETLQSDRLVVVDGAFDAQVISGAAKEMRYLVDQGALIGDPDDVCNPLQRSFDLPIWDKAIPTLIANHCPNLSHCIATILNLPSLFERELNLSLRVPQIVMMAAYPPGAHYSGTSIVMEEETSRDASPFCST